MVTKSLYLFLKNLDVLWDPFWDLQKEGADIFEIVFDGSRAWNYGHFLCRSDSRRCPAGGVAEKLLKK